ncbi:MAG TPA: glycoside hydrolase family 13 protein [Chloroflexota bacterium]
MQQSAIPSTDRTFQTPSWVQDAIFYQIFPDRFAISSAVPKPANLEDWNEPPTIHGFKGGDLLGVVERLDYLQDLGVNAIYFCPVFKSSANHRYHTYDYYTIDPILGGNEAFARLLNEAHRRSIRVVLDGVFNHCGRGFFQFNSILENGSSSPYLDWFSIYSWPLSPYGPGGQAPGYAAWWSDPALPKFNTRTQAVREFLWNVGQYWIEQGVDGWRLDVPNEIDDDDFWREFRRRVKNANSDAYIVGEIWGDATRWLQGDQFDAVMNYPFAKACLGFFSSVHGLDASTIQGTGLNSVDPLSAEDFQHVVEGLLGRHPWQATLAQLNLLDSHDTARFLTMARGDESALRLAMLFQMTFPGAPCTYYGDEIGMTGGTTVEEARGGFVWDRSKWNMELHDYLKNCIALRHAHPVLRYGGYQSLFAGGGVYAFARRLGEDLALVAFNAGDTERTIEVAMPGDIDHESVRAAWGPQSFTARDGSVNSWQIPARSGSVLVARAHAQ